MKKLELRSAIVFGTCAIVVSLFSGCAAQRPDRVPMREVDLSNWHHDCRYKEEQVAMLQRMRLTRDEQAMAQLSAVAQPWKRYTHPGEFREVSMQGMGQTNWYINYHLTLLARDCP